MDMGVALVQAYLRVHDYFTVSEYPVLEARRHGDHRMATDIDILAVRFPQACQLVPREGRRDDQVILLGDVLRFLRRYLRAHWSVLHHADFKDPAFSFLMLVEKAAG